MYQNLFKRKRPATALCMALVLAGCNGDGDSGGSNGGTTESQAPASISAQNATFLTDYADNYQVNLADKVLVSDGDSFTLVNVASLSATPECQVLEQSEQSFTISAESTKSCDYQYKVTLASSRSASNLSDSAITRVAVTRETSGDTASVELNAISATTLVEQTLEVSDIKALLKSQTGFDVEEGFVLSDVVTLPYSDHVATVDPSADTISYTPLPGFQGIERILFSYINDTTGKVLLGTLDVAVAQEANLGFMVDDNITHPVVEVNEKIEIDIAPYVYSSDSDDYQLVYVNSFNAATAPLNNDVDNKILTFQTSKPGVHHITFAVSDHNGAYAIGLIELYVLDPNRSRPWDDIFLGSKRFSAPLTTPETASNGVAYEGGVLDNTYNPPVEVALFTYAQAQAYCGTQGRLPTSAELQSLSDERVKPNHDWPLSQLYLTSNNGTGVLVDLESGNVDSFYTRGGYLVTCVSEGDLQVLTGESSYTDIIANGVDKAKIVAQLKFDGVPAQGQLLELSVPSSASSFAIEDSRVETDTDGKATFYITSMLAQSFLATVDFNEMQASAQVTFNGDVENAVLTQETVTNNQEYGSSNIVVSKLVDIYDNPIAGERIIVTGGENVKINGSTANAMVTTDSKGVAQSAITWNGAALSENRTVSINSLLFGGSGQSDSSTVTFVARVLTMNTITNNAEYDGANQVKVKLTNTFGQALSGRKVTITGTNNVSIAGSQYSHTGTTNSSGEWAPVIRWIGSEPSSGDRTVTLTATYDGQSTTTSVTFKKGNNYALSLDVMSDNAYFDGTNQVKAKLTNNGYAVSGAVITVTGNNNVSIDGSRYSNTGTTNSSGEWAPVIRWVGSEPSSDQTVTITASYGDQSTSTTVRFKRVPDNFVLTLSTLANNAYYSGNNQVKVKLTNNGKVVSGASVTLTGTSNLLIDGSQSSKTGTTNSNGEWSPYIGWSGTDPRDDSTVTISANYAGNTASTDVTFKTEYTYYFHHSHAELTDTNAGYHNNLYDKDGNSARPSACYIGDTMSGVNSTGNIQTQATSSGCGIHYDSGYVNETIRAYVNGKAVASFTVGTSSN